MDKLSKKTQVILKKECLKISGDYHFYLRFLIITILHTLSGPKKSAVIPTVTFVIINTKQDEIPTHVAIKIGIQQYIMPINPNSRILKVM
jgi:hypothetical protein